MKCWDTVWNFRSLAGVLNSLRRWLLSKDLKEVRKLTVRYSRKGLYRQQQQQVQRPWMRKCLMCGRSQEPGEEWGEEWGGSIRGLKLGNLKGVKGRTRKTSDNVDMDDVHGNIERCLDSETTGSGVEEKSWGWYQPKRNWWPSWDWRGEAAAGEHGGPGSIGCSVLEQVNIWHAFYTNWKSQAITVWKRNSFLTRVVMIILSLAILHPLMWG